MRRGILLPVLALGLVMMLGCRSAAPSGAAEKQTAPEPPVSFSGWALSHQGVGPVQIGMTLDEANAASGVAFMLPDWGVNPNPPGACAYAYPGGTYDTPVDLMLNGSTVVRIDVQDRNVQTSTGVSVGGSTGDVLRLYGGDRVERQPHKYVEGAEYLIVPPESLSKETLLLFETDADGRIVEIRVGRDPEVGWVEGCA